jgi:hypothetical protein
MLLSPAFALAQTSQADLRTTIQNSVIADPRVANIPPQQLQALIDDLVAQANAQHMTASDILSNQPQAAASTFAAGQSYNEACAAGWEGYACNFNKMFGFDGNNYTVPIVLFVTTAFLLAVIWELILHHRKKLAKASMLPPPPPPAGNLQK